MKNLDKKFNDYYLEFQLGHDGKVQRFLETFDLMSLKKIENKPLSDLTDENLRTIGLEKVANKDFEELYCCPDFDNVKIYFSKANGILELRGYLLKKKKEISTTKELIEEAFLKWRLKMTKKRLSFLSIISQYDLNNHCFK